MGFSQIDNYNDVGSPTPNSQSSDSLGRKVYGLHNNKTSLFGRDSQSKNNSLNPQHGNLSYHQQIQKNKTKAKERDERDLLENVCIFMRDCSSEIKMTVSLVKENVHSGVTTTQEHLTSHLEKLQEDLGRHRNDMIKTLQVRDDMKTKVAELEQTIAVKDAKIEELEKVVEVHRKQQSKDIVKEIQHTIHEGCETTKDHITQSFEAHKQEIEDLAKDQSKCKKEILQQTKNLQRNMMDQSFGLLQQVQNKLHEDLEHEQQHENRAREKLKGELQKELHYTQTLQREEVKGLLRQQLQQIDSISEQRQNEVFEKQQQQMEELQKKHRQELNENLQQQLHKLTKEQKNFADSVIQSMWERERTSAQANLKEQQKFLKDEMQQSFEKELRNLKERHEKEVEGILSKQKEEMLKNEQVLQSTRDWHNKYLVNADIKSQFSNVAVESADRSYFCSKNRNNTQDKSTKSSLEVTSLFRSPLLTNRNWSSKNLFSKRNPSPVATVHPLVQESEQSDQLYSMKPALKSTQLGKCTESDATKQSEPKPKQTKKKPQKRRRKGTLSKKKKPKKVAVHQNVEDTEVLKPDEADTEADDDEDNSAYISNRFDTVQPRQSQRSSKQRNNPAPSWHNTSTAGQQRLNIYDFHEDDTLEAKSNTTPIDVQWYAALNRQGPNQNKRASSSSTSSTHMRMPSIWKSPDLAQVDEGCSSVGSSPSYSVADFLDKFKFKDGDKELSPYTSGTDRMSFRTEPVDWLSQYNL